MTRKFARRFVMDNARDNPRPASPCGRRIGRPLLAVFRQRFPRRITMRNGLLTTLSAVVIAAATAQVATAGDRHHVRKPARPTATATEQFRNANGAWTAQQAQPDVYRYSGGWSAPAGH
jgi:hypothetical protein